MYMYIPYMCMKLITYMYACMYMYMYIHVHAHIVYNVLRVSRTMSNEPPYRTFQVWYLLLHSFFLLTHLLFAPPPLTHSQEKMCQLWFNTFFIDWHVMQQQAQQASEEK